MSEYRVTGLFGNDNIRVHTEWMDIPKGEAEGVAIGLELKGWEKAEVEERDSDA